MLVLSEFQAEDMDSAIKKLTGRKRHITKIKQKIVKHTDEVRI